MLTYPHINPVALQLGPLKIYWYGLMYVLGFLGAWGLASYRAKKTKEWTHEQVADLLFYGALGVIIGGRVGYVLFYNLPIFLQHPLSIFKVWEGGMSFHGGLIGVCLAMWLFALRFHKNLFDVTDFVAPLVPIGLGLGRIGNFINGELWGRISDVPWAMVFPNGGPNPRHPSQLYEFFLEGVILFIILWIYSAKPKPRMAVSGMFLICYGFFRILVEFFREPDMQLGYLLSGWFTMGMLLSLPMVVVGSVMLYFAYKNRTEKQ
jgi:phosphatidylglycerol:prolipoprotein diacylglycerol transferase